MLTRAALSRPEDQPSVLSKLGHYLGRWRHPFHRARPLNLLRRRRRPTHPVHPFDVEYGVDTSGMIPALALATGHAHDRHITAYYAIAPSLFRSLLDLWRSGPLPHPAAGYTFIDVGAGKGRALLLAAESRFRQVLGVELNPRLARVARRNLRRRHNFAVSSMRIHRADATRVRFPAGPCLLYLFHPFDDEVLGRLLQRITHAFAQRPGELDLLYVNDEFQSLLEHHPGFTRLWQRSIPISPEDAAFDRVILSSDSSETYGVTGDETCSAWRWTGIPANRP